MELFNIGAVGRVVRLQFYFLRRLVLYGIDGNILRDINQNRSRTAGPGNKKCFFDYSGKIFGAFDQVVVFGARPGDPHGVDFLKGIIADQMRRHLAGKYNHGYGIHIGRCNAADRVGRTRS